jgi:hypothetical protein
MDKKDLFHIVFKTDEDERLENIEIVKRLKEEDKSEFIFKDEYLYILGRGHSFLGGFFTSFITKSGIKAVRYVSGIWNIKGEDYKHNGDEFIQLPKPEINNNPIDWNNLNFPVVKKISARTIGDYLVPHQPIEIKKIIRKF